MASLLDLLEERPDDASTIAVYSADREVTRSHPARGCPEIWPTRSKPLALNRVPPIAVMLPNGPEVVAAMFGAWDAGCV